MGAYSFDFGWAYFGLDEANDCSDGVTLRSFMISPFTGDFACRLKVAAADYAGSCAVAQRVDAFEEAVVRTTPWDFRCGVVACWSLSVCHVCRACCCCLVAKEAHLGQITRPVAVYGALIL